jgi:hypothetical protein
MHRLAAVGDRVTTGFPVSFANMAFTWGSVASFQLLSKAPAIAVPIPMVAAKTAATPTDTYQFFCIFAAYS